MENKLPGKKLLDYKWDACRIRDLSPHIEKTCAGWICRLIRFHHMQHPTTGTAEIQACFTYPAVE